MNHLDPIPRFLHHPTLHPERASTRRHVIKQRIEITFAMQWCIVDGYRYQTEYRIFIYFNHILLILIVSYLIK